MSETTVSKEYDIGDKTSYLFCNVSAENVRIKTTIFDTNPQSVLAHQTSDFTNVDIITTPSLTTSTTLSPKSNATSTSPKSRITSSPNHINGKILVYILIIKILSLVIMQSYNNAYGSIKLENF